MKNLIRKILREQEDPFEWTKDLDPEVAEKEVRQSFRDTDYEWGTAYNTELFPLLIKNGIHDLKVLKEIGGIIYTESQGIYDNGYDSGRDTCDCDGCCDDMYYYEDVREREDQARDEGKEEGYDNGYETGKSEAEDEIEELKSEIEELKSEIEELQNRLAGSDDDLS